MIRWLHPKRCRAKLPPHEETKSIECHAMAEKISSYPLPPIPGVASSAASMLPVQAAGAVLLKAPLSPPCESSTPPDSHYTKSPDQTTVRAFSYMRFAQKQLSNKPSQSGFPALRRAQVVHAAGTEFLRAPLSPPCDNRVATAALRDNAVAGRKRQTSI